MNYKPKYLQQTANSVTVSYKLNNTPDRSYTIAQTLLHEADTLQGREANREKAQKNGEDTKKLIKMVNSNHLCCDIGISSSYLRLEMTGKTNEEEMKIYNRNSKKIIYCKQTFNAI